MNEPRLTLTRRVLAAVVTGIAVALVTHLGALVLGLLGSAGLFFTGAADANLLPQLHDQFASSSLFYLIACVVFGFIGAFRRWYLGLATGVVFGSASVLGGTSLLFAANGGAAPIGTLLGTLIGFNFGFVVAAVLAATLVGPRVYARLTRGTATVATRRVALVREPAANLDQGISTTGAAVDLELANQQWDEYVSALLDNGWSMVEVAPAPDLADSVFVEDTAVVFGALAVITSPGAESRVAETAGTELALSGQGLRIERIQTPGTLDGGDVLQVGTTVYVGRGDRTNAEGIRQLRAILAGTEYVVIAVPVTKALHLKSAVTALPDGTVIGHPSVVDDPSLFERFLAMPEKGAEVVVVSADTVLMAASAPQSQALIASLGYRVISVDISEFEKLDGCVTCLSVLLP